MPHRQRILIVEDDLPLAEILIGLLAAKGRRLHHARDAETAFEQFRKERLSLVMIDAVLPRMPGLELLRIIRSESQVPVVMMSGSPCPDKRRQALRLGAHEFLTKPFSPAKLETCVRKALAFASVSV